MTDRGIVISAKEGLAEVEVQCFLESCQKCSAQSLCSGKNRPEGILTVKNPINAIPGNEVTIEIPESIYSRALIFLFGSLLVTSLFGMGLGFLFSAFLPFPSSTTSLLGFFLALFTTGILLFRHFRKKNKDRLYPVILKIIRKGD